MSGTLRLVAKTKTPQLLMQTADAPALFPHGRRKAKKARPQPRLSTP